MGSWKYARSFPCFLSYELNKMKSNKISYQYIFPEEFGDFIPEVALFFFSTRNNQSKNVLNKITDHIQGMTSPVLDRIEAHLNLKLTKSSYNSIGNICFANDPDIRPEYRSNFHALDLWDYYYALWNSSFYWNQDPGVKGELPLPVPIRFWDIVKTGFRLRKLHSSTEEPGKNSMDLSGPGKCEIREVMTRFKKVHKNGNTAHLYLNEKKYIKGVPENICEYEWAEINPVRSWLNDRIGLVLNPDELSELFNIIRVVDHTIPVRKEIDKLLET